MFLLRPRKQTATWTLRTHLFMKDDYVCSRCGRSVDVPRKECPKCGARMTMGKYDPTWADETERMSALLDDDW